MPETFKLRTSWNPLRMLKGQKEPTYLTVELTNNSDEAKNYSLILKVPYLLGFDTTGLTREKRERMQNVRPKDIGGTQFTVFSRANIEPGMYDLELLVKEHDAKFDKIIAESTHPVQIRVA